MIHGKRENNLAAILSTKRHSITAGLSPKLLGDDEGMNPHELAESALAACTILTCQLYANKKGWDLISTNVTVKIISEEETGAEFHRDVTFNGNLTQEQRERLLEIANKTPVYNLLTRPIKISTHLQID